MYTSVKVIYGVPFTRAHADVIRSWPKNDPRHKGNEPMGDIGVSGLSVGKELYNMISEVWT